MAEKIILSWVPPFSLDLTTADPDIAYCVDVYNITDGGLVHLSSICSILSPSYTFTVENPDPKDEFEFTITPRNNMEGARNGTSSRIIGTFSLQSKSSTVVDKKEKRLSNSSIPAGKHCNSLQSTKYTAYV